MIGQTVGRFKIVEKLGEGGIGVVYKAEDLDLHRSVVLKFLRQREDEDLTAHLRLEREAQAAAGLSHANIATVYEYHDAKQHGDGHSFIAMEYVEGETLKARLSRERFTVAEAQDIIIQLARGLRVAHNHGVVHRDMKPSNVVLMNDGNVKILDFGIAKVINASDLTQVDLVVGTAPYMSPEQLRDEDVDHRTDIWSLGVMIFEMLTGQSPFNGISPPSIMYSIANEEQKSLQEYVPDAPASLLESYYACLRKDRDRRPQSMDEVLKLLTGTSTYTSSNQEKHIVSKIFKPNLLWIGFAIAVVAVAAWYFLMHFNPKVAKEGDTRWRVAVLPFEILTNDKAVAAWVGVIQAMFVSELTGVEGIGVIDPASVNGLLQGVYGTLQPQRGDELSRQLMVTGFTVMVDGSIMKSGSGYKIQSRVIDGVRGEVLVTTDAVISGEAELATAVASAAQQILDLYQVTVLHSSKEVDLRPWVTYRRQNVSAIKEFFRASEMLYRVEPGANVHLLRALELDSLFVMARVWLISSLVGAGKIAEAGEHLSFLRRHQERASPFEETMTKWADAYVRSDTIAQTRTLERALIYSPGNNILLFNLGIVRFAAGEYEKTIEALTPLVKTKWKYSPAYYLLAGCYMSTRRFDQARQILEESLEIQPVYKEIYGLLAVTYHRSGDTIKEHRATDLYLQRSKENGDTRWNAHAALGEFYDSDSLYSPAIEHYRRAIEYRPVDAALHENLAIVLTKSKNYGDARKEYEVALRLDTSKINTYVFLGRIGEALNDTPFAISSYTSFLKRSGDSTARATVLDRMELLHHR